MRIFSSLYERVLVWSAHKYASWYLVALAFTESIFFPVPVDVLLAPMVIAKRKAAWRYAIMATLASVAGGVIGYFIGYFAFDVAEPLLLKFHLWDSFEKAQLWFKEWGFWALLIAGFLPIPYKVFTISAGVLSMALLPFIAASIIGRAGRFFLVTAIIILGGEPLERALHKYMDWMAWIVIVAAVFYFAIWKH